MYIYLLSVCACACEWTTETCDFQLSTPSFAVLWSDLSPKSSFSLGSSAGSPTVIELIALGGGNFKLKSSKGNEYSASNTRWFNCFDHVRVDEFSHAWKTQEKARVASEWCIYYNNEFH